MVLDIVKQAEHMWREITKLAEPLDAKKPVIIGTKCKTGGEFEAYTDNARIYINVSDEKKFKDNFRKIVVPAYSIAAGKLYDVFGKISPPELLRNLIFDTFLFVHFHEQLHPLLCPNSKYDEKAVTKALYEGIKKAEPNLTKKEVMFKVNGCKNLIWDFVLNTSFVSKTSGYNNENLEQKISYVFQRDGRQIEYKPVTHYPSGILPIVYMMSAHQHRTDIPISLVGALYGTMSYNDAQVRKNAMNVFFDDLNTKKISEPQAIDLVQQMYKALVKEIPRDALSERGIFKDDFRKRISMVPDFANPNYEENQKYFVGIITQIFDVPGVRYDALKGLIQVLSKYILMNQKVGSPDPNTMGQGGEGGEAGSSSGSSEDGEDGEESEDGDEGDAKGAGGKSQEEMDGDSMEQTLDDLIDVLDPKEADDLLGEVAKDDDYNPYDWSSRAGKAKAGKPSGKILKRIANMAADEYYKKNADIIEVHNPSQENVSYDLGKKKKWKLRTSKNITAVQAARLNHRQITNFQTRTGLPVLIDVGGGYFRLNEYELKETPLKSYTTQMTGIEIPDNWVMFQDSSGSMAPGQSYVGTGCRFDILNRVKYGIKKGLVEVCKAMGKDLKFGVVDFSDVTVYSGLDSLVKVFDARSHPIKKVSLSPQCGGTHINSKVFGKIAKDLAPGKTIYTFITDGEIYSGTTALHNAITKFVSGPDNAFVFIEIASRSSFGQSIEALSNANPSVMYYCVKDVKSIKDKLSSVLIRYG